MSVHQLPGPCWVLTGTGDDGDGDGRHFGDEAEAKADLATIREDNPDTATVIMQAAAPCWLVQCDGDCEQVLDREDEGVIYHHPSRGEAEDTVRVFKWARSADGRFVYCPADAPAAGDLPGLSPAEQEAAGQLPFPGVPG